MSEFSLILPFWIDTDAYTDRDRNMFVSGFEFCEVVEQLKSCQSIEGRLIHTENESRVRMAAGRLGRRVSIKPAGEHGEWSLLDILPKDKP